MGHVGLIVLHIGMLFHQLRMLFEGLGFANHHLVHHFPAISDLKANCLVKLNPQSVWREFHVITHVDRNGATHCTGRTGDTPGHLLGRCCFRSMAMMASLWPMGPQRDSRRCRQDSECSDGHAPLGQEI